MQDHRARVDEGFFVVRIYVTVTGLHIDVSRDVLNSTEILCVAAHGDSIESRVC